jgi:sporulation protein YlmC with PRC-barrel domain
METQTLMLALLLLPLAATPALAEPCRLSDLPKQVAALPDFIVLAKDEKPRDALTRALGCDLPPPALPSLANGQKVQPMSMIGKYVFDTKGESFGVIKDVVVDRQSLEVNSVIKRTPALGAVDVAVPVDHLALSHGEFSLLNDNKAGSVTVKPFSAENDSVSIANATPSSGSFWMALRYGIRPWSDQILIRVDSEPPGASFFVHDNPWGTTEIQGLLRPADAVSIRLELKGYRPCRFGDGTYRDPTATGLDYATFLCKLTTVH